MAPSNVHVDSLRENSLIVRFDALPSIHHGGPGLGYNVYYTTEEHHHDHDNPAEKITVSPPETHVIINGLESMREYYIFVAAFNDEGEGPRSQRQSIVIGKGFV